MIKDILRVIQSFIRQPIVPTVSIDYILKNDCSYVANSFMNDDYILYYHGNFKKGKTVKVRAIDIARHEYNRMALDRDAAVAEAKYKLQKVYNKVNKVETHDLGETFVKNEIIKILKGELEDDYENEI